MSIKNMRTRINYAGGSSQNARMNADKLKSLKKALLYSYQSATAVLADGREFRCLINSNKLNLDIDNKILSIPFKDTCLNAEIINDMEQEYNQTEEGKWEDMEDLIATLNYIEEDSWEYMVPEEDTEDIVVPEDIPLYPEKEQEIGVKEGDVITWKENGSHWLVYLRRLEETAYFRGDMRRCRYQLVLGNGAKYWAYVRGPIEQSILWNQMSGTYINKLNYTLNLCISQNEETLKYFSRFKKIMINNKPWEVQAVDSISTPGIIEMTLKETFSNIIETNIDEAVKKAQEKEEIIDKNTNLPYILGKQKVYPYETYIYELKNYNGEGHWVIERESRKNIVELVNVTKNSVKIQITTGRSGEFYLAYRDNKKNIVTDLSITIESL